MNTRAFACLNCGGVDCEAVYRECIDYYLGKPSRVDYVRCSDCGLVQQSPVPEDVSEFYEAYPVHTRKSQLHETMRRALMSDAYFDASSLADGSAILDYGCGDGWYLDSLDGRNLTRIGFEPDQGHAEQLSERLGVRVFSDTHALLRAFAGAFDVVTMHFVMEHVTDLHDTFSLAGALLRPGGRFYFVVPNVESWEARVFKRKWHSLDPPRHISFPGRIVAESLAAQHGMRLVAARPRPFSNGVAGSVPVLLTGRFSYPLFLLALPLGIVMSRLSPSGAMAFESVKAITAAEEVASSAVS